jgi:hypothetical protein
MTKFSLTALCLSVCAIGGAGRSAAKAPQYANYSAGHCPVVSQRSEGDTSFYNIRNSCDGKIIVFWAVNRPARGDFRTGNAYLEPGEVHETQVEVGKGIETYACQYPHHPVTEDGEQITRPVDGYTCR